MKMIPVIVSITRMKIIYEKVNMPRAINQYYFRLQ